MINYRDCHTLRGSIRARVTDDSAPEEQVILASAIKYEEDEVSDNHTCSICLCDISEQKITLYCSHIYHYDCLATWFNKNRYSCPNCRHKYE